MDELYWAISTGDLEKVARFLEKGTDINVRDEKGIAPIHIAASLGNLRMISFLVEKGANVNVKDREGWTPLHYAASKGHHDAVKFLVEKGADINALDNSGQTPLHVAANKGYFNIVRFLVEKGANVNVKDREGWTPLHYAAFMDNLSIIRYLLKAGADPKLRDARGRTPIDLMRWRGHHSLASSIEKQIERKVERSIRSSVIQETARFIDYVEVDSLVENKWGYLRVSLKIPCTLTIEGEVEWLNRRQVENLVEMQVKPKRPGRLSLVLTARSGNIEEKKTIELEVIEEKEYGELINKLRLAEEMEQRYQTYLEKLEQLRKKGVVSDRTYEVLRNYYLRELLKWEAELEQLKKKLKTSIIKY